MSCNLPIESEQPGGKEVYAGNFYNYGRHEVRSSVYEGTLSGARNDVSWRRLPSLDKQLYAQIGQSQTNHATTRSIHP